MKFQAPPNSGTSVSLGGETFCIDENGVLNIDGPGDYAPMLLPHGFKLLPTDEQEDSLKLAELQAAEAARLAEEAEQLAKQAELAKAEEAARLAEAAKQAEAEEAAKAAKVATTTKKR